jgi:hypothetical protein
MKRHLFTIIAFILTILMVLVAGIYPFFESASKAPGRGQFAGTPPQGFPSDDNGSNTFQGQGGLPPEGMPANRPDGQGLPSGNNMSTATMAGIRLLLMLRLVAVGLVALLGGIAAVGLWLRRGWGTALAVISAMIALGLSVPSLFRVPVWSALILPAGRVLLAVLVVFFALLAFKKREPAASYS